MWVVVWSEDDITGPFATEAQAYASIGKDVGWVPSVVRVHAPNDPTYNRDLTLHGILIRDD